jgi:hypothetical protein
MCCVYYHAFETNFRLRMHAANVFDHIRKQEFIAMSDSKKNIVFPPDRISPKHIKFKAYNFFLTGRYL